MDHWNRTTEDGLFSWSDLTVQHPWSSFLKNQFYTAFGPLTRCRPNLDQEEWPCTKSECADIFNICPKKAVLENKQFQVWPFFYLLLSSSSLPLKKFIKIFCNFIALPMGPCLFLLEHLFCLSHRKTRWTMSADNVGLKICLLGNSSSPVTLTFSPWCKLKLSRDEFNSQS